MDKITIKPDGVLTFDTIAILQEQIKQTIKTLNDQILVFDLSHIDKCDSAGLALLIDMVSQLNKRSLGYQFVGISPALRSLAKFYEVESLLLDGS